MIDSQPTITRDWTATAFVVAAGRTLLVHHRKLNTWLPPGGHIDPNELPHLAAIREVYEETGLTIELLGPGARQLDGVVQLPQPLCLLLEDIEPGHQHIDLIYVGRVVGGALAHADREHHAARWFSRAELADPQLLENVRVCGQQALDLLEEADAAALRHV